MIKPNSYIDKMKDINFSYLMNDERTMTTVYSRI